MAMHSNRPDTKGAGHRHPAGAASTGWLARLEADTGRSIQHAAPRGGGIVCLAIDCSGSMSGNPLLQARDGAIDFARSAIGKGYRVGLVSFDSAARILHAPTSDLEALRKAATTLRATGGTNMKDGLRHGRDLVGDSGTRVICIATDGYPNDAAGTLALAEDLRAAGIDIMAVGTEDADQDFLSRMVSREELAVGVRSAELQAGIRSMAKLLPGSSR